MYARIVMRVSVNLHKISVGLSVQLKTKIQMELLSGIMTEITQLVLMNAQTIPIWM